MEKKKVGIDIDDVCWDLVRHWLDWYNWYCNEFCNVVGYTPTYYDDIKSWNISEYVSDPELLFSMLSKKDFWKTMPKPDMKMIALIEEIYDTHDVYFITSTDYRTPKEKFDRFLEIYNFVDKTHIIQTYHKELVKVDYLIDDNLATIQRIDNLPIEGILFERPWNKDWEYSDGLFYVCSDWNEIYDFIMFDDYTDMVNNH